jgi:hypothetical protein
VRERSRDEGGRAAVPLQPQLQQQETTSGCGCAGGVTPGTPCTFMPSTRGKGAGVDRSPQAETSFKPMTGTAGKNNPVLTGYTASGHFKTTTAQAPLWQLDVHTQREMRSTPSSLSLVGAP